ncbi:hypothetical protein [Hirschia baltica]|uniref:Uncharacterized protein n=1 Tax=Hirschia baltica (strain ATCC 49814 / DSM 5838 / IFAM 1418) TaxID=582402 RepID=C6XR68_HIRBI|nr:hypothetical protein [Hirschia baltica]ACT60599.1 hypothetical protein Hbal_2930 [Hirschia baltica ATCC 49814]
MALQFSTRVIAATSLLTTGLIALTIASQNGEISVRTAGLEVKYFQADAQTGKALEINQEQCPPQCPLLDINWKKYADATSLKILR